MTGKRSESLVRSAEMLGAIMSAPMAKMDRLVARRIVGALLVAFPAWVQGAEDRPASVPVGSTSPTRPFRLELTASGWLGSLEGCFQTPRGGEPGTSSQDRPGSEEIGLDGLRLLPVVEARASFRGHEARFEFAGIYLDGDETLEGDLVSQGQTFPAGSRVESRLEMPLFRLGYRAGWLPLRFGNWSVIPEAGGLVVPFRITIDDPAATGPVDRSFSIGAPYLGLLVEGVLTDSLKFEADISGSAGIAGMAFASAEARIARTVLRRGRFEAALVLGLRGLWLHRKDDQELPNELDARLGCFSTDPWAGLTFGLRIGF
jgi:hypothetical protein